LIEEEEEEEEEEGNERRRELWQRCRERNRDRFARSISARLVSLIARNYFLSLSLSDIGHCGDAVYEKRERERERERNVGRFRRASSENQIERWRYRNTE